MDLLVFILVHFSLFTDDDLNIFCLCLYMMNCVVCRENHKCGLEISGCKHVFCSTCLYKWFGKKHDCPLCRGRFSLFEVQVKYFRNGIKTRREKRLIEEEMFILDLAILSNELKRYHLQGDLCKCGELIGCILNKCLVNIDLFLDSTNEQIHMMIKYLKYYDIQYSHYVSTHQVKYMKLMNLLKGEIKKLPKLGLGDNIVIINNLGPIIV